MTHKLAQSFYVGSSDLRLEDFEQDEPYPHAMAAPDPTHTADMIDGVSVTPMNPRADSRGSLCELLTTRTSTIEPIVHVYQVTAEAGSCRAWVYHRRQHDRLAFVNGRFRIVLYDIRSGSPTFGLLNVFILGRAAAGLLRIPPFVIHGVQNIDQETSTFVNMPTRAWDPSAPDKCRLPRNDPRIPFDFDA